MPIIATFFFRLSLGPITARAPVVWGDLGSPQRVRGPEGGYGVDEVQAAQQRGARCHTRAGEGHPPRLIGGLPGQQTLPFVLKNTFGFGGKLLEPAAFAPLHPPPHNRRQVHTASRARLLGGECFVHHPGFLEGMCWRIVRVTFPHVVWASQGRPPRQRPSFFPRKRVSRKEKWFLFPGKKPFFSGKNKNGFFFLKGKWKPSRLFN